MSDTRRLTPLIDHTQIATTMAGAPAAVAVVLVRCGDGWQAPLIWRAATVTPATLGDYDGEATIWRSARAVELPADISQQADGHKAHEP